jgi:hypothetical protein
MSTANNELNQVFIYGWLTNAQKNEIKGVIKDGIN